jgi:hypothetical protein
MAGHLIPFRGKQYSGPVNQNLLWRSGLTYLMDNHRAALWCWQQAIDLKSEPHNILHIDRHTDTLAANLDAHVQQMPSLRGLAIEDYLDAKVSIGAEPTELFRWDNYLSIHIKSVGRQLRKLISVDHQVGDHPAFDPKFRPKPDELPENFGYWLSQDQVPWIINIDLDYFFCPNSNSCSNAEEWIPLFSKQYVQSVFKQIGDAVEQKRVKVITLCLTPSNFTPGWEECLCMSRELFDVLRLKHPIL